MLLRKFVFLSLIFTICSFSSWSSDDLYAPSKTGRTYSFSWSSQTKTVERDGEGRIRRETVASDGPKIVKQSPAPTKEATSESKKK